MSANSDSKEHNGSLGRHKVEGLDRSFSRRTLLGAGALLGLGAMTLPAERAHAWSSWTNATSPILKKIGMGDCVHEDLVQIAYARVVRKYANDTTRNTLLNPWAGTIDVSNARYATIAQDTVDKGEGKTFTADDLAIRLYRENLAYLRIGSFWNDAAADILLDFAYSCAHANDVPKFSGNNYYEGAWDVGQHIRETQNQNGDWLNALVQFTMNDRNNFIHGMLSSTADCSGHLKQSEIKTFALQWLSVVYEYARTGKVQITSDVPSADAAQKIFNGFIDTYSQLDENVHNMRVSLKVGPKETGIKHSRRRMRLRALGMMCHTMEDFWCPAHTCRTYVGGSGIAKNSILAFCNYKKQNGDKLPMFGYHIPFDRYALSDADNNPDWREMLTRGDGGTYKGTNTLANVLANADGVLEDAHTYFNTLGMNETIACITQLFEYFYTDTPWDSGVRAWIDTTVMPTYFDEDGQSYVCDAGRRSLHTPTFIIVPIQSLKRAYRKAGQSDVYKQMLACAKDYDAWQRGAHLYYSGSHNNTKSTDSKLIDGDYDGTIWTDGEGQNRLIRLVNAIYDGSKGLDASVQSDLLARIGANGCHDMIGVVDNVRGMLQDFSIDLNGGLRSNDDDTMSKLSEARAVFESGLKDKDENLAAQSSMERGLLAPALAYADESEEHYETSDMVLDDLVNLEDGSRLIAVRDMDSLETSIMSVPKDTPGADILEEGVANLTITYKVDAVFENDVDHCYVVSEIDYAEVKKSVHLVTGAVESIGVDEKSLFLDMNGTGELMLTIPETMTDIPLIGSYICARYSEEASELDLIGYDELDDPGDLKTVTYPVEKVAGSRLWLWTNRDTCEDDGYNDYLEIEYDVTDVHTVPQEGNEATVVYHDEAYGSETDVDERALAATGAAASFPGVSAQAEDDDLEDSPESIGYKELIDDESFDYGTPSYGNEVFHVANVISDPYQDDDPVQPVPAPVTPTSSTASSSSTSQATTSSSKATSKAMPKTGDMLAGFGGIAAAVAAAGAALAAYSARRVANETNESDEE